LAQDYDRQVFAVPGRLGDEASAGCLNLIARNQAAIFTSVDNMLTELNWGTGNGSVVKSKLSLPNHLTEDELRLITVLATPGGLHIDDASFRVGIPLNILAGILLKLEFDGLVVSMPGKKFKLANNLSSLLK